jgi:hypothetical protein
VALKAALQCIRRMVVLAAYACFALRIAIPAGFMPAPLAEGGPVVVCDGGFDGALLARAAAPHGHHHDPMAMGHDHGAMPMAAADHTLQTHGDGAGHEGVHAAWKHCPVGAVFGIAALASVFVPPFVLDLAFDAPPPPQAVAFSTEHRAYYRSRAPPFALS